jgi:hypothetical protein
VSLQVKNMLKISQASPRTPPRCETTEPSTHRKQANKQAKPPLHLYKNEKAKKKSKKKKEKNLPMLCNTQFQK